MQGAEEVCLHEAGTLPALDWVWEVPVQIYALAADTPAPWCQFFGTHMEQAGRPACQN